VNPTEDAGNGADGAGIVPDEALMVPDEAGTAAKTVGDLPILPKPEVNGARIRPDVVWVAPERASIPPERACIVSGGLFRQGISQALTWNSTESAGARSSSRSRHRRSFRTRYQTGSSGPLHARLAYDYAVSDISDTLDRATAMRFPGEHGASAWAPRTYSATLE